MMFKKASDTESPDRTEVTWLQVCYSTNIVFLLSTLMSRYIIKVELNK